MACDLLLAVLFLAAPCPRCPSLAAAQPSAPTNLQDVVTALSAALVPLLDEDPQPPDHWPATIRRGRVLLLGTEPDAIGASWTVTVAPDAPAPRWWAVLWDGRPVLVAETLGPDWLVVSVARTVGGELRHDAAYIGITEDDEPEPEPEPEPQPDPTPPKVAIWAFVVEERNERLDGKIPIEQAIALESWRVKGLFKPLHYRMVSDDETDPGWEPYLSRARGKPMPYLFLLDDQMEILYQGPFPKDTDAAVELVEKYQ